jgi:hypothetical protein
MFADAQASATSSRFNVPITSVTSKNNPDSAETAESASPIPVGAVGDFEPEGRYLSFLNFSLPRSALGSFFNEVFPSSPTIPSHPQIKQSTWELSNKLASSTSNPCGLSRICAMVLTNSSVPFSQFGHRYPY